ncbi:hypothetical protein CC1G_02431 [Coprinopsis cinerea okayama7|uniref:Uncharacterized protein n=1 Tax=Coprinopsis cinerea (strain Okayama-7 / 130 / ATCC MYA-4618 / FGSC 9003) TaxID=240176 RepID=A8NBH1_COPC7|nr:hypothetical protein CC1G_02431 [Coprinopsis cinerea okayama7\|eukprot:XP_001832169.1 hypothetical protein CC1G_02431 [Coprinopsis cinerea okayama7\
MTEYDYSPEAWERYFETQHRIARWVDGTLTQRPCNAFTPATPHVKFLELQQEEKRRRAETKRERPTRERRHSYDVRRDHKYRSDTEEEDYYPRSSSRTSRHSKSQVSTSQVSGSSSRRHERSSSRQEYYSSSRDREKDRSERRSSSQTTRRPEKEQIALQGQGYVLVEKSRTTQNTPTSTRASTPTSSTRPRSNSSSPAKPSKPSRSHTAPNLSLDLPPVGVAHDPYHYRYPRLSAGANSSGPSSGSTTNGGFPPHQIQARLPPPNSAPPVIPHAPQPIRSQTVPGYGFTKAPVPSRSPDPANVPQLPYSAYASSPTKANGSTSLLKRMFTGLAISKQSSSPKPRPAVKETSGGKRVLRKRSLSF